MPDLNQLAALLNGLGPWGIVIGALLFAGLQYLRSKSAPTPSPLLDAAIELIRLRLAKQLEAPVAPVKKDIDDEQLNMLIGAVGPLNAGKKV